MTRERLHRKLFASYLVVIAAFLLAALLVAPRRAELVKPLLVGGGAALLVAAALTSAARELGRTMLRLAATARSLGEGRFAGALPRGADDELDELAESLGEAGRRLGAAIPALAAEGERLRTVLDGMSEGVALLSGGRIAFANPAFTRLLDVDGTVEGRTPLEALRRYDLAEAIAAAGAGTVPEARDLAVAGGRVLQLRAAPLAGGSAVVVLLDVTEARSLERMRREFVANASHELRTPVAAIRAVAETLVGSTAMAPADRARFERILLAHAERLSRLVDDLLDLSRAEAGSPRPEVGPVPLAPSLQSAIAAVRERAEAKRLRLEESLPADLPPLAADATALEQVLVNLLDNAVKYTPDGGRVVVRAVPVGATVRIEVEDNGPGIPAEHLPRLFERFYRVDPARSRAVGGTGLGLAIVKHLVQAHGGEVGVASTVGVGTTFRATFPIAAPTATRERDSA